MIKAGARILAATLLSALVAVANAAPFPERAITIVIPFSPGGGVDGFVRVLAQNMSQTLGQPIIVESRPGGATTIAASHVAREKPDGYTLLLASNSTLVTNRFLFKKLSYDPDAFAPIGMVATGPMVLLSNKHYNFKTLAELISYAKEHPNKLSIASHGTGTMAHLAVEYLEQLADIDLLHTPFKGTAHAMPQFLGGNVDLFFDMLSTGMPQIAAGKADGLAVTSGKRWSALPDTPSLSETYPDFQMLAWFTLVASPGTPTDITATLRKALQSALQDEAVKERLLTMGIDAADGTAEAFAKQISTEIPLSESLIKRANITMQ